MAQLGNRAVYRQTGFLVPVAIEKICCGPHFIVRLATIDGLCLVSSRGAPPLNPIFQIAAAWEHLAVDSKSWSFACSGYWRLKLDEVMCDAIVKLCQEKPDLDPMTLPTAFTNANPLRTLSKVDAEHRSRVLEAHVQRQPA